MESTAEGSQEGGGICEEEVVDGGKCLMGEPHDFYKFDQGFELLILPPIDTIIYGYFTC